MTSGLVAQRQQTAFTTPANGDSGDATVVLSNDNATRSTYNGHDADATIHVQLSTIGSRPAASVANRTWIANDTFRVYVDSGASWNEIAYLALDTSGHRAGNINFASNSSSGRAILMSTSDGSDNEVLFLSGGGGTAADTTRGAFVSLYGNELNSGLIQIGTGNVSGAKLQILTQDTQRVSITHAGDVVVGSDAGALATNATNGFLYVPSCAGTPTGAPTAHTGSLALVYDSSNNKFYIYNGGWKGVTLS